MKGVLLAGGSGTRLGLSTRVTNKHLLAIYDRPMLEYPLRTLLSCGVKDILVVTGKEHAGHIMEYLGSGADRGVDFTYRVQDTAGGLAQALGLAKNFSQGGSVVLALGDNIFDTAFHESFKQIAANFTTGAHVFLVKHKSPQRFGVAQVEGTKVVRIIEKPKEPPSDLVVTGLYMYDNSVFEIIQTLKPSARGELEITDVQNAYLARNQLKYTILDGYWSDAGTPDSLHNAWNYAKEQAENAKK